MLNGGTVATNLQAPVPPGSSRVLRRTVETNPNDIDPEPNEPEPADDAGDTNLPEDDNEPTEDGEAG